MDQQALNWMSQMMRAGAQRLRQNLPSIASTMPPPRMSRGGASTVPQSYMAQVDTYQNMSVEQLLDIVAKNPSNAAAARVLQTKQAGTAVPSVPDPRPANPTLEFFKTMGDPQPPLPPSSIDSTTNPFGDQGPKGRGYGAGMAFESNLNPFGTEGGGGSPAYREWLKEGAKPDPAEAAAASEPGVAPPPAEAAAASIVEAGKAGAATPKPGVAPPAVGAPTPQSALNTSPPRSPMVPPTDPFTQPFHLQQGGMVPPTDPFTQPFHLQQGGMAAAMPDYKEEAGGMTAKNYDNLMRFGLNLMAAGEGGSGPVGPSFMGAVGKAGQQTMAGMDARDVATAAAAMKERHHKDTMNLGHAGVSAKRDLSRATLSYKASADALKNQIAQDRNALLKAGNKVRAAEGQIKARKYITDFVSAQTKLIVENEYGEARTKALARLKRDAEGMYRAAGLKPPSKGEVNDELGILGTSK